MVIVDELHLEGGEYKKKKKEEEQGSSIARC